MTVKMNDRELLIHQSGLDFDQLEVLAQLLREHEGARRSWFELGGFGPLPESPIPYVGKTRTILVHPGLILLRWDQAPKTLKGFVLPDDCSVRRTVPGVGTLLAVGLSKPGEAPQAPLEPGDRVCFELGRIENLGMTDGDEQLIVVPYDAIFAVLLEEAVDTAPADG